jgi:hypothetical protein
MTATDQTEYRELRATIRERGTARVWMFVVGIIGWAGVAVATAALVASPLGTLVPLLVLVATFEAIFALHVGVERIGRYLQVTYESERPAWEHAAMAFGTPSGAARIDALFTVPFAIAAALNLVPALLVEPTREEVIFIAGAHALFLLRIVVARAAAKRQRAVDVARFRELKADR